MDLFWDIRQDALRSPIDGVISKVYRESAGPIRRGEPIVEVVDLSKLEVMAELLTTDAVRLHPGAEALKNVGSHFHVDITFKVSEIENALKVPVGALFRDGSSWAVYVAEKGHARKQNVEVGGMGSQEALIQSGLKEGQSVLVYPGDLVKEGSRIRADTTR